MDKMKQAKDMYGNMKKMQQEVDKIVVEASSRNKLITIMYSVFLIIFVSFMSWLSKFMIFILS